MNESTCNGIKSGHGCDILKHPAQFELRFKTVVDLRDINHHNPSFWKAKGQKNPFGALTAFSILKVSQVKQAMVDQQGEWYNIGGGE